MDEPYEVYEENYNYSPVLILVVVAVIFILIIISGVILYVLTRTSETSSQPSPAPTTQVARPVIPINRSNVNQTVSSSSGKCKGNVTRTLKSNDNVKYSPCKSCTSGTSRVTSSSKKSRTSSSSRSSHPSSHSTSRSSGGSSLATDVLTSSLNILDDYDPVTSSFIPSCDPTPTPSCPQYTSRSTPCVSTDDGWDSNRRWPHMMDNDKGDVHEMDRGWNIKKMDRGWGRDDDTSDFSYPDEQTIDEHDFTSPSTAYSESLSELSTIDITEYGTSTLYLLSNNLIRYTEDGNVYYKKSNITPTRIFTFNGRLYSLDHEHYIRVLRNNNIRNSIYYWDRVSWFTEKVSNISVSYDDDVLWIGSDTSGYLYDSNMSLISKVQGNRVYGNTRDHYLEISNDTIRVFPTGSMLSKVNKHAILDHHNKVITSDRDMRYINYKVVYL